MTSSPNLARLLLDRFRWFDDALRAALDETLDISVTPAQSLLFADLSPAGVRQADLARSLGVSRQAVNELVAGLVKQGLVESVPDPSDRRAKLVRPTELGTKSVKAAQVAFCRLEEELAGRIGEAAVERLREALQAPWGAPPLPERDADS